MKNEKLKIAGDALWLAITAFQNLQNHADENKGYFSNDIQYEISTILEHTEHLLNDSALMVLSNLKKTDVYILQPTKN
jgi:hypothetical protein